MFNNISFGIWVFIYSYMKNNQNQLRGHILLY